MNRPLPQFAARSTPSDEADALRGQEALVGEWLETDGLGGYAASTVAMCPARRYHGLLVAPFPGTAKRHLFLAGLREHVVTGRETAKLSALRQSGDPQAAGASRLECLGLESFGLAPWPRWSFRVGGRTITREVLMPRGRPAVLVRYCVAEGGEDDPVGLTLRPLLAFREADKLTIRNDVLRTEVEEISAGIRVRPYDALPAMTMTMDAPGWSFHAEPDWIQGVEYAVDLSRGYEGHEDLFCPGRFEVRLRAGEALVLAASIGEAIEDPAALWHDESQRRKAALAETRDLRGRLATAADDFLYRTPGGRRGVLAGFPWFGEWGRDTFIALPGLTLARGDLEACAEVLSGALPYLQGGLLPNIYGVGVADSHYGSVDASLWFARAVLLYQRAGGDAARVRDEYLPALLEIARSYRAGIPSLGIEVDEGLLIRAGDPTLNPTWMDAKTSTGAVTPRHGFAVEICALWYSLLAHLAALTDDAEMRALKRRSGKSFLARFWLEDDGYLADVWRNPDEVDVSVRPNMILAAALEFSPLNLAKRKRVLARAERDLLTPMGLRTLAPDHPDYQPRYEGGPDARDGAYHQGTVWPWLLGFYCEASLRVDKTKRNRKRLRALLEQLTPELDCGGLDHIAEVYDGDAPRRGGGSFAQAWNTAETLRALALLGDDA